MCKVKIGFEVVGVISILRGCRYTYLAVLMTSSFPLRVMVYIYAFRCSTLELFVVVRTANAPESRLGPESQGY
jgi:hypothetical protein